MNVIGGDPTICASLDAFADARLAWHKTYAKTTTGMNGRPQYQSIVDKLAADQEVPEMRYTYSFD
jgi:hypothetical protein